MLKGTIIYIGGFELPDKNAAAHRVLGNAKAFRKLGYGVVFIDADKSLDYDAEISQTKRSIQGFECWSVPYPDSISQWIDYLSNIDRVKDLIEKYGDVQAVICYNYQAAAFIKLKAYCRKKNIVTIADCTEWYSCRGNGVLFGIIKGLDSFARMRIIHKKLDGLIVISHYLEKYYRNCNNVICIPPLVDIKDEKWKRANNKDSNDFLTIAYAGSPGRNKDRLDVVIDSISGMESHRALLNIIGITKEEFLRLYPDSSSKLANSSCEINFLGRLEHTAALDHIKSADFTLFFRDSNRVSNAGFPTKLVESISCGVPVITNLTSNIADYIKDGHNGYIIEPTGANIERLFNKPIPEIKKIKDNISNDEFNYENYTDKLQYFVNKIENNR